MDAVMIDDLGAIAKHLFDVDGEIDALPGERDLNALIREADGTRWVLKVATDEGRDVLETQTDALRWLERTAPDLPVPRVRPARDGADIASHEGALVRVYSYLDGVTLADGDRHAAPVLESVGRLVGGVDRALAAFERPGLDRPFRWNPMHGFAFARANAKHVTDGRRRTLLDAVMQRASADLEPLVAGLRTGTIHGDANDYNVLLSHAGPGATACGLIDFGDMMSTWLICGPAIACAYAMLDTDDPLAAASALLRGVHAANAIPAPELDAVLPLVLARLSVTVTNAARARVEEPANAYLQVTEDGAWRLLAQLDAVTSETASRTLREACYPGAPAGLAPAELGARRARSLGPSLSVSYREPLTIMRGDGIHLFDDRGRAYIDCVNNVCHVGHCHPRVVRAGRAQMGTLNTNTRYLHPGIVTYAERLAATLPEPLSVCYFVNSGSEANELALRMARVHTGRTGVVALEAGYHGNTPTLVDISHYKCAGPGGAGAPPHVAFAACPDPYRGPHRGTEAGPAYADAVRATCGALADSGSPVAAFIAETLPGCGGQIIPPPGWLPAAHDAVREAGGVCIADEVQTGFGRVGTRFWSFELQDAVPDIITMGKPIGNGHPIGAVVTTPAIAASFDNGMEYFNTFGGNPVSCAIGLAVLDVIEAERLQEQARTVGAHFLARLRELAARHELIGDVRGAGLYLGVELVRDRSTLEPAADEADEIVNRLRDAGILVSTDGPLHNVLKIKPPLVMRIAEADRVCDELDRILGAMANG
jgi:4-aminobutyrate aminotransferase-like enzyme/Ser/Thr protein kinase RdoA (MazF antagonist)